MWKQWIKKHNQKTPALSQTEDIQDLVQKKKKNGQTLTLSTVLCVEVNLFLFTGSLNTHQIRSVICVHSGSPLKPDKPTVFKIKVEHSDKVDLVLLFWFSWASQDDVWDSYCADKQLQICLASWLVGGWVVVVVVVVGGCAWVVTLKEWSERKRSFCIHFVFFEAVVCQKTNRIPLVW